LAEAIRVLKPGGQFACLEFSRVENQLLRCAYDTYSLQLMPVIGQLVAGDFNSERLSNIAKS
jgi:ubiquinone/menaquinone biosynthesis C-methylase UbiE